jgi:uncharacterized membrane protein HdeD (DUF308 family)
MDHRYFKGKTYRVFSFALGSVLLGVGVCVMLYPVSDNWLSYIAGIGFSVLGGNMMWSAYKAQESWVSKIGPLP